MAKRGWIGLMLGLVILAGGAGSDRAAAQVPGLPGQDARGVARVGEPRVPQQPVPEQRVVEPATGRELLLYRESHALVIGMSAYRNGWPPLYGVTQDVEAVRAALETAGFTVEVSLDLDHDGLANAFRSFVNRVGQKPDNRLLFYYAGHGHTMKLSYGGTMGYLVPVDAPNPHTDPDGFHAAALSMQEIEVFARRIQAKHALFLFDSCFSGSIFEATRAIPEAIQEKTSRPVRQFITSGSAEQTVPDNSIFRRQFVAALSGSEGVGRDGYLTGAELGQFLEDTVTNYSRRSQTPQYGKLRDPNLDKGDFVFILPRAPGATVPPVNAPIASPASASGAAAAPSGQADAAELAFWDAIKGSTSPDDYRAYLEAYPRGHFAPLARLRAAPPVPAKSATPAPTAPAPAPPPPVAPVPAPAAAASSPPAPMAWMTAPPQRPSQPVAPLAAAPSPERAIGGFYPERYRAITAASFSCEGKLPPVEVLICGDARLARADGVMAQIYKELRAALPASEADAVRQDQRGWIKRRDQACPVSAADLANPAAGYRKVSCLLAATDDRISELWS